MDPRASELIERLELTPHPEGGFFREIFRSDQRVQPDDERPARSAMTSIYFLLSGGQHSRWHRVTSDEAWHFQEGDPLELYWIGNDGTLHRNLLAAVSAGSAPTLVVPAGCWQAARPTGSFSLVACTVGPGFDFADFEMFDGTTEVPAALSDLPSDLQELL